MMLFAVIITYLVVYIGYLLVLPAIFRGLLTIGRKNIPAEYFCVSILGQAPRTKPTARGVFQFFVGIHALLIESCQEVILNCNEYHHHQLLQLLQLLGERYIHLYANSR